MRISDEIFLTLSLTSYNRILHSLLTYKSNFFETYRKRLQQLSNLRVLQHANAVQLVPNPAGKKMEEVQIRTLTGKTGTVRAATTIVCCGGIESARLLLASNQVCSTGLGNQHDLVGRFFQDHLDYIVGIVDEILFTILKFP